MSSERPAITVERVTKRYRVVLGGDAPTNLREAISLRVRHPLATSLGQSRFAAVDDVSFEVAQGEVFGLVGANGAGKSTLLKILTRITTIDRGRVTIRGRVGSLLEVGTGFHPELTGRENVFLNGMILGMREREVRRRFDEIVDFAGVGDFIDTPVKRFSSGMQVRLAFSVAAHLDAEVLLVDEVLAVGDLEFQRRCIDKIEELARNAGRTVLFVSHNMAPIRAMCGRTMVLAGGRVAFLGDTAAAVDAYLRSSTAADDAGAWDLAARPGASGLRSLRLLDAGGLPAPLVSVGDHLTVSVGIGPLAGVRRPVVGVRITDDGGAALASFVTPVEPSSADAEVELTIPSLPLTPGRYGVDTWIIGSELWVLQDLVVRAGSFRVESPGVSVGGYKTLHGDGSVVIDASWSVDGDGRTGA